MTTRTGAGKPTVEKSPLHSEPRNHLVTWRLGQNGMLGGVDGALPLADRWGLANAFRRGEFELLQIGSSSRYPILASQCAKTTFGQVILPFEPR